jgi:uncharacterized protein YjiS (DUF1127 family)
MTCNTHTLPLAASQHSWTHWAIDTVKNGWHAYWQNRHDRATMFLLQSLSDRTLADIGVHRSEIASVVGSHGKGRKLDYHAVWE